MSAHAVTEADVLEWVETWYMAMPRDILDNVKSVQLSVVSSRKGFNQSGPEFQLVGYPNDGKSYELVHGETLAELIDGMRKLITTPAQRAQMLRDQAAALVTEARKLEGRA